jgi:hypothetical protein
MIRQKGSTLGRRRDFLVQMPRESSAVPTKDGVGPHYLETSPPAGPASVQHNPQEPVARVEAQATRRVLLANRKVGGEARGSPPAGQHGFENWRLLKRKRATKRELIVVATMISRMVGTPAFSDRTEFSVCTARKRAYGMDSLHSVPSRRIRTTPLQLVARTVRNQMTRTCAAPN